MMGPFGINQDEEMPKTELVQILTEQRDAILQACDAMTDEQRLASRTPEGWRAQDFVGHLAFWDQYTLNCLRDTIKNGRPAPVPADAADNDMNERAVAQRKKYSWQRVRAEFENTRNVLIQRIEGLAENDLQFYVPSPWMNDERIISLETIIREESLEHGAGHLHEFKIWQQSPASDIMSSDETEKRTLG